MNRLEKQMLYLLTELKKNYGASYVRAEFEQEGLRVEELLRLKDISLRAGLGLSLKIGGCEGMRDLIESKVIGADAIVAPMVESAFALRKYNQAAHKVYSPEERQHTQFWFNLETITAAKAAEAILSSEAAKQMDAMVLERVDLCFSQNLSPDNVDDQHIDLMVRDLVEKGKKSGLRTIVGGGVSARSGTFLGSLVADGLLDFFETRKVGFSTAEFERERYCRAILLALAFEIFFIKNKIGNLHSVSAKDLVRMNYLEMNYWGDIKHVLPQIETFGVAA